VEIRKVALPLAAGAAQAAPLDHLLAAVGDAHFVLIGEASHGTREFQTTRAEITRRLIESKGFQAVAVEADWPDAYRVNRFVRGQSDDAGAIEALAGFKRFPAWMWRNTDVVDFVGWLKEHNDRLPAGAPKVGFYGLDLYSLYASIDAIIATLDRVDPEAGRRARRRYAGLDHLRDDAERYGLPPSLGVTKAGEDEAIAQLRDMRRHAGQLAASAPLPADRAFFARLNARVVASAETYDRAMFRGHELSWNLRDLHMAETLNALPLLLDGRGPRPKIVVWAHNMHVGDARQTGMGEMGELDVGQIIRQTHGADAALVGFTTYRGTVTAASAWGGPAERRNLRAAPAQSYEALFHEVGLPAFMLDLRAPSAAVDELRHRRLERAIGVVYLADSERASHTFNATLPGQFDHVIHVDESCAIEPLERTAAWIQGEMPAPPPPAPA
jgi:erythromycin esterase-like protein